MSATMPSNVRLFWWLSVAIVAYWIFDFIWYLAFPSIPHLATIDKLPLKVQVEIFEAARRGGILTFATQIPFWGSLTLVSAWLAAFRHLNWARWAFVIVFLLRKSLVLIASVAYYHNLDIFTNSVAHENWTDPREYVESALAIAAIVFVFSGNARSWFRENAG